MPQKLKKSGTMQQAAKVKCFNLFGQLSVSKDWSLSIFKGRRKLFGENLGSWEA